jgi:hypothetical protein
MPASPLILYTGPNCSLCKKAEDLLYRIGISEFDKIDVTSNLELKKRYGLKIPLLKRSDIEPELFWPFGEEDLVEYLS